MKNIFHPVQQDKHSIAHPSFVIDTIHQTVFFFLIIGIAGLLITGCSKAADNSVQTEEQNSISQQLSTANPINQYTDLSMQTQWELQQVRAATAKYQNLDNAIRDGYADISVDVQHMGHHYMKTAIVDATFDMRQPEILVYNRNARGVAELVAVEYAVPLSYPRPEGFTGSADVWKDDSGFPFWLLHAWVYAYNPDGVFNWTNPLIDLH